MKVHDKFSRHLESLVPRFEHLLHMEPVKPTSLPRTMCRAGIYLFSENGRNLYVGRSNNIRDRIGRHCRPSATHRMAAFAFRLAREETGSIAAAYRPGPNSRAGLLENPIFLDAFNRAKARIRIMDVRYVEEHDPVCQTLLELYVAVVLSTPYNDFDNH